jgi:hypothetical protein
MQLYTFKLRDGFCAIADDVGVTFADRDHALCYAYAVVGELMNHRERETRMWRLDVYEDHERQVFEIPFARLDETLDQLNPHLRSMVEDWRTRSLSLLETFTAARVTMRESRALVARSRGRPYLATDRGRRVIREGGAVDFGRQRTAAGLR